jgi:hypothetical protein
MTDIPPPKTPPGWYPDGVENQLRFWDGAQWTEEIRTDGAVPTPAQRPEGAGSRPVTLIRGVTGSVELDGDVVLYFAKPDRPALQRIPLDTVRGLIVSTNGDTFDLDFEGSRRRSRPSLFSETSLRRNPRTRPDDWQAFLATLERAIAHAVPKFAPGAPKKS